MESHVLDDGSERLRLDVRGPAALDVDGILAGLSQIREVARIDLAVRHSPDLDTDDEEPPTDNEEEPPTGILNRLTVSPHR